MPNPPTWISMIITHLPKNHRQHQKECAYGNHQHETQQNNLGGLQAKLLLRPDPRCFLQGPEDRNILQAPVYPVLPQRPSPFSKSAFPQVRKACQKSCLIFSATCPSQPNKGQPRLAFLAFILPQISENVSKQATSPFWKGGLLSVQCLPVPLVLLHPVPGLGAVVGCPKTNIIPPATPRGFCSPSRSSRQS